MVPEHFDDPAVRNLTTFAFFDHSLQFASEGFEALDTQIDFFKLLFRDCIGSIARLLWIVGQAYQVTDGLEGKTQLSRMADEF